MVRIASVPDLAYFLLLQVNGSKQIRSAEVIDPLQLAYKLLTIEYKIRHESPTPLNIKYELHQNHRLRTVTSQLPGGSFESSTVHTALP